MKKCVLILMALAFIVAVAPVQAQLWSSDIKKLPDFSDDSTSTKTYYIRLDPGVYADSTLQLQIYQDNPGADSPHVKYEYYYATILDKRRTAKWRKYTKVTLSSDLDADSTLTVYRLEGAAADTCANEAGVKSYPTGLVIVVTGLTTNEVDVTGEFVVVGKREEW